MRYKILSCVLAFLILFGLLTGCNSSSIDPAETSKIINTYGNSTGNIANNAIATIQDEWIYYRNLNKDYNLYKIKKNGTCKTHIKSDAMMEIAIIGDWIYYTKDVESFLYKMRTDGTMVTQLNNDKSWCINVVGEWIYYNIMGLDIVYPLYKIKTDGTQRTQIDTGGIGVRSINVVDNYIYYVETKSQHLCRMNTDGSDIVSVIDDKVGCVNLVNGWIYYVNSNDGNYIYKIKVDGTGKVKLNNDSSNWINVTGGWIYYCNGNDQEYLYKMRIDGTDRKVLSEKSTSGINVVGDWIFYLGDGDLYRMRIDGSGNRKV